MPGLITHYVFGKEAVKALPDSFMKTVLRDKKRPFYLGTQGPDLFSYRFYRMLYHDHRNIGSYLHHNRTKRFFLEGVTVLNAINSKQEREYFFTYLTGFLCHYILDSICHPFVYARTNFDPNHPTNEYYGRHLALENRIDSYYAKTYLYQNYEKIRQNRIFDLTPKELDAVSTYLSKTLIHTFEGLEGAKKNTPRQICKIIQTAKLESKLLSDPNRKKTKVITSIEKATIGYHLLSDKLITRQPEDGQDYLNLSKKSWKDPWNPEEKYNWSFPELFSKALDQAVKLLSIFLENPLEAVLLLDDTSYYSGTI